MLNTRSGITSRKLRFETGTFSIGMLMHSVYECSYVSAEIYQNVNTTFGNKRERVNERTNERGRCDWASEWTNERIPHRSNQHLFCQSVIWRCLWQQWQTVISTKTIPYVQYIQSFSLGDLFACICAAYFQSPHHDTKSGVFCMQSNHKNTHETTYLVYNRHWPPPELYTIPCVEIMPCRCLRLASEFLANI